MKPIDYLVLQEYVEINDYCLTSEILLNLKANDPTFIKSKIEIDNSTETLHRLGYIVRDDKLKIHGKHKIEHLGIEVYNKEKQVRLNEYDKNILEHQLLISSVETNNSILLTNKNVRTTNNSIRSLNYYQKWILGVSVFIAAITTIFIILTYYEQKKKVYQVEPQSLKPEVQTIQKTTQDILISLKEINSSMKKISDSFPTK